MRLTGHGTLDAGRSNPKTNKLVHKTSWQCVTTAEVLTQGQTLGVVLKLVTCLHRRMSERGHSLLTCYTFLSQ